jgi:hypothetical protein
MKEDSSRHFFLTSRPKSNYGNSFLLRRQSESWARNFSSPSDSRVTAIDRHWKSDENDTTRINPVFHCLPPIMVSYDYPLFFLATGISWTSFLHLPTTFSFYQKSHFSFSLFCKFNLRLITTKRTPLSSGGGGRGVAVIVSWLFVRVSVGGWILLLCWLFTCVCVCVLEPVFIKTDVSLFTPMPRLDELVSSSKVE